MDPVLHFKPRACIVDLTKAGLALGNEMLPGVEGGGVLIRDAETKRILAIALRDEDGWTDHSELIRLALTAKPLGVLAEEFNNGIAESEGWAIFCSDTYGFEIEADSDATAFIHDEAAEAFVRWRAGQGSSYHQQAIEIHDRQRAELRDVAKATGYTVDQARGRDRPWFFRRPKGGGDGGYHTEADAWAGAYADMPNDE